MAGDAGQHPLNRPARRAVASIYSPKIMLEPPIDFDSHKKYQPDRLGASILVVALFVSSVFFSASFLLPLFFSSPTLHDSIPPPSISSILLSILLSSSR